MSLIKIYFSVHTVNLKKVFEFHLDLKNTVYLNSLILALVFILVLKNTLPKNVINQIVKFTVTLRPMYITNKILQSNFDLKIRPKEFQVLP